MKKIYVAGPYSCVGRCEGVGVSLDSMRQGLLVSAKLLELGFAPFSPWLDYLYHFLGDSPPKREDYYAMGIEWLKVSDAMLVIELRASSKGTRAEIEIAEKEGIPIYYGLEDFLSKSQSCFGI